MISRPGSTAVPATRYSSGVSASPLTHRGAMAHSKNGPGKRSAGKAGANGDDRPERLAAYFLSLTLENVRCFGPKQTLDLSDRNGKPAPWTIILGLNGTGKTTLLQSLAGCQPSPPPNELTDRPNAYWPRFIAGYKENPHGFRRGGQDRPAQWELEIAVSGSLAGRQWVHAQFPFQIGRLGALVMEPRGTPTGLPWCCGYGASRRLGIAAFAESDSDESTATLFSDRADLRNPEEWLLRLDYAASKSPSIKAKRDARFAQVEELLLSVLPEIEGIRLTTKDGTNPTSRAEFKTPYGWVPLKQLGYGYQTLITWVADFANRMVERYSDSPDPLAEPAVCLVDEIDLHLHPKWQRELMGFLTKRFPNTQFIATAHSPLVAQAAADANLAVLRREGDHVVIDNDVDNIRNWRVDQILTSDLFGLETARPPQIEKFLLERRALLSKAKLTAKDRQRLNELDERLGELPYGETAQERQEREEIRKTLDLLKRERKPAQ